MSLLISDAHAQAAAGAAPAASPFQMPILMVLMLGAMYFLLIRPQQKRAKEHQNMLSKLASGDEVVTAGGILAASPRSVTASSPLKSPKASASRCRSPRSRNWSRRHIQERLNRHAGIRPLEI